MKKTLTMSFRPKWRNLLGIKSKLHIKKKVYAICIGLITLNSQLIIHNSVAQNVGINSDGSTPETNTMLDVKSAGTTSSTFGLKIKDFTGSEKMVVRSDGNVGIGIASPSYPFHVEQSHPNVLATLKNTNTTAGQNWGMQIIGGTNSSDYSLRLHDKDGGDIMTMNGDGRVGIGTTTPASALTVFGGGVDEEQMITLGGSAVSMYKIYRNWSSGALRFQGTQNGFVFYDFRDDGNNSLVFINGQSKNVGIGTAAPSQALHVIGNGSFSGFVLASCGTLSCSDIRYKKNIMNLENVLDKVTRLNGVRYNWKQEEFPEKEFSDRQQIGIIAQELEKVYPQLVRTDDKGYKTVDYSHLTPILVEAIKEQQQIIESQKNKIEDLETKDNNHKKEVDEMKIRLTILEESLKTANK